MLIAADYPFLEVLGTLLIFFAWVIWFWLLITILADLFRRPRVPADQPRRDGRAGDAAGEGAAGAVR